MPLSSEMSSSCSCRQGRIVAIALVAFGAASWQPTSAEPTSTDSVVQRYELEIPRVTRAEFDAHPSLRSGLHAFVITDGVDSQWQASKWTIDYLNKTIPDQHVEFYPFNMEGPMQKPYEFTFANSLDKFGMEIGASKAMQMRLDSRTWALLKKDFEPTLLPDFFWDDDEWIGKCMKKEDGEVDTAAIDNFLLGNRRKQILIGEENTMMSFHQDNTAASSMQAQLTGSKLWTLCPHTETKLLNKWIKPHKPDYEHYPGFAKAVCGQVNVSAGEVLYYPGKWWHATVSSGTPTIAFAQSILGSEAEREDLGTDTKTHAKFLRDFNATCNKCWREGMDEVRCDDPLKYVPGGAHTPAPMREICKNYLTECYKEWDKHFEQRFGAGKTEL